MAPSGNGNSSKPQHRGLLMAWIGGIALIALFAWLATRGGPITPSSDGVALDSILSAISGHGNRNVEQVVSSTTSSGQNLGRQGALSGNPRVLSANSIELNGVSIVFFAIYVPAPDATCTVTGQTWACGQFALSALNEIIGHAQNVTCTDRGRDPLGRVVGVCQADGRDIAASMLRGGWALANGELSPSYHVIQTGAQLSHNGINRGKFDPHQFVGY